ncbi:hypothetical protein [Gemmobacter serpentinus]|uniref:hypothetical protein n=1 Tax=Gemmobacter serpentinus TaxID=2652247 RepID=UPI00124E69DF|nr:hypothetical protein [Gemmobacter serpentinus]
MELMRQIASATETAISGAVFHPVLMVWLDWPGGPVRAHSGVGSLSWGGNTWAGVSAFGAVSVPDEAQGGVPVDFSVSLTCDLPELADCADAVIRQREGAIYLGVTTEAGGNVLVGAPVSLASGTMDVLVLRTEVERQGADVQVLYTLTVTLTTGPGYRSSAAIAHSHEDQSRAYPGDTAGKMLVLATARAEKTLWPEP